MLNFRFFKQSSTEENLWRRAQKSIRENRKFMDSVAALFGGNIVSSVLGMVGGLIAARFVGPEDMGLFRQFSIPLMYLTFLHFGTWDGLWRQIPFHIGKNNPERAEVLALSAGAWSHVVSILVSLSFVILALFSLWHKDYIGVFGWLTQAFSTWAIFYGGYLSATYRTTHQFVVLARIQLIQSIVNFCLLVFVQPFQYFGLCIRSTGTSITGAWLYHRHRHFRRPLRFNLGALTELLKIGAPFSLWGNVYTSAWVATESALMVAFGDVYALGLFGVAVMMREGMNVLPQAINQVLLPRVVEEYARSEKISSIYLKMFMPTAWLTAGMIVVVVCVSYLVAFFVPLVLPKYVAGISLMQLCLWFPVVQTAALPISTIFASGRQWALGRGVLVGIIVFPVASYFLIPFFGGMIAVVAGSLLGRIARTVEAYCEVAWIMHGERGS